MENIKAISAALLINFLVGVPMVHFFCTKDGAPIGWIDSLVSVSLCSLIIAAIFAYGGLCVWINERRIQSEG